MAKAYKETGEAVKTYFQSKRPRQLDRKIDASKIPISINDILFDDVLKDSFLKSINKYLGTNYESICDVYNESINKLFDDTVLLIKYNDELNEYEFKYYKKNYYDVGCVYWLDTNESFKKWNKDAILLLIHYYELFTTDYLRWFDYYYERIKEYFNDETSSTFSGEEIVDAEIANDKYFNYISDTQVLLDKIKSEYKIKGKYYKELDSEINKFKEKYKFIYDSGDIDTYNEYVMMDSDSMEFIIMIPDYKDMGDYINEMLNSKENSGIEITYLVSNCNQNSCSFIDDLEVLHRKIMEALK